MPSSRTAISLTWTSPSSPSQAPALTASPSPMSAWAPGAAMVWRSASTESPPTRPTRERATALCWTPPRWRRPWSRWTMLRTRTWARAPAAWWASMPTAARAACRTSPCSACSGTLWWAKARTPSSARSKRPCSAPVSPAGMRSASAKRRLRAPGASCPTPSPRTTP